LIRTKKYRQQVAEAMYQGIVDFYATARDEKKPAVVATRGAAR
jgi:hypothetical protein